MATRQSNLALVYQALGRYEEAVELLVQSHKTLRQSLGKDYPNTQTVLQYIQRLLGQDGDNSDQ